MSRLPLIRPEAKSDLAQARLWYERRRRGLGDRFIEHIRQTMQMIQDRPEAFPVVQDPARRALVKRFPYAVFFVHRPDRIVVIAVLHQRQSPRQLQGRL